MSVRTSTLLLAGLAAAASFTTPASARLDDPLPRVEDALCPGIAGFDTASALRMVDRIRATAQDLGRRLADPETCKPNVIVAVVDDGRAVIRQMYRDSPELFVDLDPIERRALLAQEGPVNVFSQLATRTRDGMPVPRPQNLTEPPQSHGWMAHSKIYTAVREDIVHVLVLLNRDAIGDKTIGQLADYATMRALLPAAARARTSQGSILTLFDGPSDARASGLTPADRTLLATFYEGIPNLPGTSRLADLDAVAGRQPITE